MQAPDRSLCLRIVPIFPLRSPPNTHTGRVCHSFFKTRGTLSHLGASLALFPWPGTPRVLAQGEDLRPKSPSQDSLRNSGNYLRRWHRHAGRWAGRVQIARVDTGFRGKQHLCKQHCNVGNHDPHLTPYTETNSRWTLVQKGGPQTTKLRSFLLLNEKPRTSFMTPGRQRCLKQDTKSTNHKGKQVGLH